MERRNLPVRTRVAAAAVSGVLLAASACVTSGGRGGSPDPGQLRSTIHGSESTIQGDRDDLEEVTEEVFRVLDIQYAGRQQSAETTTIRGYAGTDQIIVTLEAADQPTHTLVLVEVQEAGRQFNRDKAEFILREILRWRAT